MKNKLLILLFGVSILTLGSCTGGDNTSINSIDSNISESLSSEDIISSSNIDISSEEESIVISIESIESISSSEEVSLEIFSEISSNKTGDIDLPFIP